jgi:myo-inositol-1(or 4)-monophosphatase
MIETIESFAREIAMEAGGILLRGFRSDDTVVSYKSRTNLVTNMDRASEEFLFSSIARRFPDHSIVAEEGSEKEASGDYLWYVDPLDGTNNYAHGIAQFCVSIGVFSRKNRRIVAGVVFDPCHDEMFTAVSGRGAFLNGKGIGVSTTEELGYSILATGFPYDKDVNEDNNLREFARIVPRLQGIRRMGAAALDLAAVACGRIEGYWERGIKSWDVAAGSLLVQEAGGTVTGYRGEPLELDGSRIVASNGPIHRQLLELLAPP